MGLTKFTHKKWYWRLAKIGLLIAAIAILIITASVMRHGKIHQDLLDSVLLGSTVRDLVPISQHQHVSGSRVMIWTASKKDNPDREDIQLRMDGVTILTKHGLFAQKYLGEYRYLIELTNNKKVFTGEVSFFVYRPFQDSVLISFVYIDGRLVEKGWGYLPG